MAKEQTANSADVVMQAEISFIGAIGGIHVAIQEDDLRHFLNPGELAQLIGDLQKRYTDLIMARIARGATLEPGPNRLENYTSVPIPTPINPSVQPQTTSKPATQTMSKRRTLIVWGWIVVVVALGICPPWATRSGYPLGYRLIFLPPHQAAFIDQSRLCVQWILTSVVGIGMMFAWPSRKEQI